MKEKKTKPSKTKQDYIRGTYKEAEYMLFAEWIATPMFERVPKTQTEFAKKYELDIATLSQWKHRKGFYDLVAGHLQKWGQDRTSTLIGALYNQILGSRKPTGRDIMVWLQYVEKFSPKTSVVDETPERELDPELKKAITGAIKNIGLASILKKNDKSKTSD